MTGVAELLRFSGGNVPGIDAQSSAVVDTSMISSGILRVAVSSFTGGTAPTITWSLMGLVAGTWVTLHTEADKDVADGTTVIAITPDGLTPIVMPSAVRLDWSFAGDPTVANITYALVGRN